MDELSRAPSVSAIGSAGNVRRLRKSADSREQRAASGEGQTITLLVVNVIAPWRLPARTHPDRSPSNIDCLMRYHFPSLEALAISLAHTGYTPAIARKQPRVPPADQFFFILLLLL